MVNIFVPTPSIQPSAGVNIGHTIFFNNIYIKKSVWYNKIKRGGANESKSHSVWSSWFLFGLITYFVLRYLEETDDFLFALICGLYFYFVLFIFLIIHEKTMKKKYAEFENKILSPVFYKTNGNFKLYKGKIKSANIYFCEDGIALISLDEKPYVMEEIKRNNIYRIQSDDIHFNINTSDGKFYIITMPDAKTAFEKLKEKDWIIQI